MNRVAALICNPDAYRIEKAVAALQEDTWTVAVGNIEPGDHLVFWKAKGSSATRGIVALGEVLTSPATTMPESASAPFWPGGMPIEPARRVRVRYIRPAQPLWVHEDPTGFLESLVVARSQGNRLFSVSPQEWSTIQDLFGSAVPRPTATRTSDHLTVGNVYTREDLKAQFGITDATINTGIYQPPGHASIWLFVTEKKTPDRTQYHDELRGDLLEWDSQPEGRKDHLIIEHRERGLEVLLFYRAKKYEYVKAGFRFEGAFRYESHQGSSPAHFRLLRVVAPVEVATPDSRSGQGYADSPEVRRAIELQAMAHATKYFVDLGYEVEDTSANRPYDLVARRGAEHWYVEVKGTQSRGETVLVTRREVEHARAHAGLCVLYVLHSVVVEKADGAARATGGVAVVTSPWVPTDDRLSATQYEYRVPT
jgi:hypothetical protein